MENQKSNSSLKAIIVVLSILLVGSLTYMYKMSTDSEKVEKTLTSDKEDLLAKLKKAEAEYTIAINEKSGLESDLVAEREKIQKLIAEVEKWKGDANSLARYKKDYFKLKNDMDNLIAENKRLKGENAVLTTQRDSTMNVLDESRRNIDTLMVQNENLSQTVAKAAKLQIMNLHIQPYKERSSGKLVQTDKARRVDVIRVTFTIAANEVAQAGNKMYYVQVIDPKNNVIGEKATEVFGDYSLTYSFITNAIYENKTIQVNETISGKDFAKGIYHVNVFDKGQMVANTTFNLK